MHGAPGKKLSRRQTQAKRGGPEAASPADVPARPRGGARPLARATPEQMLGDLIARLGPELRNDAPAQSIGTGRESRGPDNVRDGVRTLLELSMNGSRYVVRREPDLPVVAPPSPPPDDAGIPPGAKSPGLSPREHEIARMIAKGHPNKTIAMVLDISCWTVGTHVRRIFAKLGVGSRAAMIAKLMEDGWSGEIEPSPIACTPRLTAPTRDGAPAAAARAPRKLADGRSSREGMAPHIGRAPVSVSHGSF